MKKLKVSDKKKRTSRDDYTNYNFENHFKPKKPFRILIYALVILLPVVLSYLFIRSAKIENGVFSFPLDDPWIHLTFAKNLAQYFSFSYFKSEMVTAGSTSPLYTFILSLFFFISGNEMEISYILGMIFFAAASFAFYKLCNLEFDNQIIFALICSGIFIMDKWMNFIAGSGMETTMYILILILCAYFYKKRSAVPFAVMLGLIMWTRPDGVAFIAAVIVDYILLLIYSRGQLNPILFSGSDLKKIIIIFAGILGLYFLMNFALSGSLLPNTYNAKLTYYSPEFRSRLDFLKLEVWEYFKTGAYYVLMIGFLMSVIRLIHDIYTKKYNPNTIYIVFILALVFIYWLKLPYAHRFGRYMMPIIPFFILLSVTGFRDFAKLLNKFSGNPLFARIIFYIWTGIIFFMGMKDYDESKALYATECKYIYQRQVSAALWLKKNTTEKDVIATHDVGAIGYYSGRKIVDVAGLVTPELINKINDADYVKFMTKYLKDNKVTYLAFLREWYRVSNQTPVFTTVNTLPPEVMEVYKFNPDTHILSREANSLLMNAQSLLRQKASPQLKYVMNRVLEIEPNSSLAYYYLAFADFLDKNDVNYEKNMLKAITLFPDFRDAQVRLGIFYKNLKRYNEAITHLQRAIEIEPDNVEYKKYLKEVQDLMKSNQAPPAN
ncbi:MAG: tetratricopeptide repeat protein [Ignavibacteria bacterium]|nr:tetratricopeptide repeat protein [Ignavibacteria bacterium]